MTTTGRPRPRRDFVPPRWGTPRDESFPTLGHECSRVAERFIGRPLMPHQQYMADVIGEYELVDGEVRLRYSSWDAAVPRQSGKTVFSFAWLVQRVTMMARRYNTLQQGLYVAQRGRDSVAKFDVDFCELLRAQSRNFTEVDRRPRNVKEWRWTPANGKENLRIGAKGILYPAAPTRDVGHSKTLDVVLIDEAFAFSLEEAELIDAGVGPTMATRTSPQIGRISSAGDEKSSYWWSRVLALRAAVDAGLGAPAAGFEWSVPDDVDPGDEDAWWEFLPALGRTITVDYLRDQYRTALRATDPDKAVDLFRRGYLNQWPKVPRLGVEKTPPVVPMEVWDSKMDPTSSIDGALVLGVDVSPGGASSSVVAVGRRPDGLFHVEMIDCLAGAWWLEQRVTDLVRTHRPAAVAIDAGGPAAALLPELVRAVGDGCNVERVQGAEYAAACEAFVLAVTQDRIRHLGDVYLATAIGGVTKRPRGDRWIWDRRSELADISPLVAVTVALRTLERLPPPPPPTRPARVHSF